MMRFALVLSFALLVGCVDKAVISIDQIIMTCRGGPTHSLAIVTNWAWNCRLNLGTS